MAGLCLYGIENIIYHDKGGFHPYCLLLLDFIILYRLSPSPVQLGTCCSGYRLSVKPFSVSPLHLLTSNNPFYGSTGLWRALLLPGRVQYATKRGRLCLHVFAPIHAVSIAVPADRRAVSHPRQIGKLCCLRLIPRVGE